jgi:hypothetical protein
MRGPRVRGRSGGGSLTGVDVAGWEAVEHAMIVGTATVRRRFVFSATPRPRPNR